MIVREATLYYNHAREMSAMSFSQLGMAVHRNYTLALGFCLLRMHGVDGWLRVLPG